MPTNMERSMTLSHIKHIEFFGQTASLYFGTDGNGIVKCDLSCKQLALMLTQHRLFGSRKEDVLLLQTVSLPNMNLSGSPEKEVQMQTVPMEVFLNIIQSSLTLMNAAQKDPLHYWMKYYEYIADRNPESLSRSLEAE